LAPLMNSLHGQ